MLQSSNWFSIFLDRKYPKKVFTYFYRLEALNVGWTNMTRGAVVYLVICLSPTLLKLNLSGCRETLLDEGKSSTIFLSIFFFPHSDIYYISKLARHTFPASVP